MITLTDEPDPRLESVLVTGLAEYNATQIGHIASMPGVERVFIRRTLAA